MASARIRVQPRARADEIVEVRDGALVVRVKAPPLEGRANRAVTRLLAKHLGVPASAVTVARGEGSRDKLIEVEGLAQSELDAALGL